MEDPSAKPRRVYRRLYEKKAPAPTLADKPYRLTVAVHPQIEVAMRELAHRERRPVNDVVRAAVLHYFDTVVGEPINLPTRSKK